MRILALAFSIAIPLITSFSAVAAGASTASVNSSIGLSLATGSVVAGTTSLIADGSKLVIKGLEKAGNSVIIVLKGTSEGITVSVKTIGSAVGAASLAVGTSVTVVADASGHTLMVSGKVVAYIPNALGRTLIHSKRTADRETVL